MPPSTKIVETAAPIVAGDDVREVADPAFREELAGGERQELAFTRGDRGAEQADPERQVLGESARSGNAAAEELARKDLGERQHHDAAERERRDEALGAEGDRPSFSVPIAGRRVRGPTTGRLPRA